MKLLCLDLELNKSTDEDQGGYTTDIIQIGACIVDTETRTILDETFNEYCSLTTPMDNGELRLSKFITTLTGISQETIDTKGIPFKEAHKKLVAYARKHKVSRNGLQWGGGDFEELKIQLNHSISDIIPDTGQETPEGYKLVMFEDRAVYIENLELFFAPTHYDIKKIHQTLCIAKGVTSRGGLSKSANTYGVFFGGTLKKHDALSDAIVTAKVYLKMLEMFDDR